MSTVKTAPAKVNKNAVDADVKALLQSGSDFEKHLSAGDMAAAMADLDRRDAIAKKDKQAWDLALKKHNELENA